MEKTRERIKQYKPAGREHEKNRSDIVQKSLAAFLDHLPPRGQRHIANDINKNGAEDDDDALYGVFDNLYTALRTQMLSRSKPPSVTESPNADADALDECEKCQQDFRDCLLKRDNNCCTVTGDMDHNEYIKLHDPSPDVENGLTEAAHIIPFAYGEWDEKSDVQKRDVRASWEALYRCFPAIRDIDFKSEHINSLGNGLTFTESVHRRFGLFHFAFKPTDKDNVYDIEVFKRNGVYEIGPSHRSRMKSLVTFENHDKENERELPRRELLECHWIVGKILHASGMAEAILDDFEKWYNMKVEPSHGLKQDGSTDVGSIIRANPSLTAYVAT